LCGADTNVAVAVDPDAAVEFACSRIIWAGRGGIDHGARLLFDVDRSVRAGSLTHPLLCLLKVSLHLCSRFSMKGALDGQRSAGVVEQKVDPSNSLAQRSRARRPPVMVMTHFFVIGMVVLCARCLAVSTRYHLMNGLGWKRRSADL
jgi:hypothetical protein